MLSSKVNVQTEARDLRTSHDTRQLPAVETADQDPFDAMHHGPAEPHALVGISRKEDMGRQTEGHRNGGIGGYR